jgi:hypothetical protein
MPISDKRLLELAISGLETQRERIDEELASLQARTRGATKGVTSESATAKPRKRRKRTAAQRKAHSERMKKIWAARRKAQK